MKERPILFSGPMVRAILDGRKTVTRRVVKPAPQGDLKWNQQIMGQHVTNWADDLQLYECPYGLPGDRLWVREAFLPDPDADHWSWDGHDCSYYQWSGCGSKIAYVPKPMQKPEHCIYREGWNGTDLIWRPSIHMPRWASRILLEITAVRVERLQDISEEQAEAEGVERPENIKNVDVWDGAERDLFNAMNQPKARFRRIWEDINGANSWEANPWVWAVEFRRAAQ